MRKRKTMRTLEKERRKEAGRYLRPLHFGAIPTLHSKFGVKFPRHRSSYKCVHNNAAIVIKRITKL
jgi:hypothetical protein